MSVQNARVRARVSEHRSVDVTELRVNRGERRDRMPLAEHERVLTSSRRIRNVEIQEPAIEQRDERHRGRERAAGVQSLVDGVAALFQRQETDVGVFNGKELEEACPYRGVPANGWIAPVVRVERGPAHVLLRTCVT